MKKINKGKEPAEWTAYRLTPDATYKAIPELRQALLEEQGYICAYCMRRIPCQDQNSSETSRIEHIKCRNNYPELQLNYKNMVLCCPGAITDDFHCDKKKDDDEISFSPFDNVFINSLKYRVKDGEIKSANPVWDDEINRVLNLNNALLKANRREVLAAVCLYFEKNANKATANRILASYSNLDNSGQFKPYCGVVIWFMKHWLARQGK